VFEGILETFTNSIIAVENFFNDGRIIQISLASPQAYAFIYGGQCNKHLQVLCIWEVPIWLLIKGLLHA